MNDDVKNRMKILVYQRATIIFDDRLRQTGQGPGLHPRALPPDPHRPRGHHGDEVDRLAGSRTSVDTDMQFLYAFRAASTGNFMNPESFEQIRPTRFMGDAAKWIKGEERRCVVTLFNGNPIQVTPPNFDRLKDRPDRSGREGDDTAGTGGSKAHPGNRRRGPVPLFVAPRTKWIKVDTGSGEYVSS